MKRNHITSIYIIVFLLSPLFALGQTITKTILDKDSGMSVPYAIIYNSQKTAICSSNSDGIFSMEMEMGTIYVISQIGYKPVTITSEQLLLDDVIRMEMLPYELSPVVITADAALRDIYRAIDSTYKRIQSTYSTPFYLRCYKRDEIFFGDTKVFDTKAIIDIKTLRLRSAGKGALGNLALKGIEKICILDEKEDAIPLRNLSPIAPINDFLVGFKKQYEEGLTFTRISSEDNSTLIIAYQPRSYYQFSKSLLYPSGRFFIDFKTWRIIRIDIALDGKAIEYQNIEAESTNAKKIVREQKCTVFFSNNGIPSKIEHKVTYSLKANPSEIFTWTLLQVYKDISKAEHQQKPSNSYNPSKFIIQQKSISIPDFDAKFKIGFQ